jgi:hypothetical protein
MHCMYAYVYVCVHVCMHVCTFVISCSKSNDAQIKCNVCMYVYVYVCMHVCICVCYTCICDTFEYVYECVDVYVYTHIPANMRVSACL